MNIARLGRRAFKILNVNTTLKDCFGCVCLIMKCADLKLVEFTLKYC